MRENIINLGKTIVKELNLDPGVDTLSRWMSHYISEQITIVGSSRGKKKTEAEQRCFETILKLWKHRAYYSHGHRPFENYEAVFRALERFDPDKEKAYFYNETYPKIIENEAEITDETKKWLNIASQIDQVARIMLEFVFSQAMECTSDEKTLEWLRNTAGLPKGEDISIIIKYIDPNIEEKNESETARNELVMLLESRIKKLKVFSKFNKELILIFQNELEALISNNTD